MQQSKWLAEHLEKFPEHSFDGELFKKTLKAHEMTLTEFARERGINRVTLYRRIRNQSSITMGDLALCEKLFTKDEVKALFPYLYR